MTDTGATTFVSHKSGTKLIIISKHNNKLKFSLKYGNYSESARSIRIGPAVKNEDELRLFLNEIRLNKFE